MDMLIDKQGNDFVVATIEPSDVDNAQTRWVHAVISDATFAMAEAISTPWNNEKMQLIIIPIEEEINQM